LHGKVDGEGGALKGGELGTWEDLEGYHAGDEGLGVCKQENIARTTSGGMTGLTWNTVEPSSVPYLCTVSAG